MFCFIKSKTSIDYKPFIPLTEHRLGGTKGAAESWGKEHTITPSRVVIGYENLKKILLRTLFAGFLSIMISTRVTHAPNHLHIYIHTYQLFQLACLPVCLYMH